MIAVYMCGVETSQHDKKDYVNIKKIKTRLRALKCNVVVPNEQAFVKSKISWSDTMENRIELLKKCQAIYVLPQWKECIMARIELQVAMDLNKEALFHPTSNKEMEQVLNTLDN